MFVELDEITLRDPLVEGGGLAPPTAGRQPALSSRSAIHTLISACRGVCGETARFREVMATTREGLVGLQRGRLPRATRPVTPGGGTGAWGVDVPRHRPGGGCLPASQQATGRWRVEARTSSFLGSNQFLQIRKLRPDTTRRKTA